MGLAGLGHAAQGGQEAFAQDGTDQDGLEDFVQLGEIPDVLVVAGLSYTGLTVLTVWHALRGQSVVAPDSLTLAVAGALTLLTALGLAWALRTPPERKQAQEDGRKGAALPS